MFKSTSQVVAIGIFAVSAMGSACAENADVKKTATVPAQTFDLSHWKITLPADLNSDGKVDEISVKDIKTYSHPDFFYLDEQNHMIFVAPNKGARTKNTSNTRSELRYMLRGKNTKIKTHGAGNNFAVEARKDSDKFGSVGGKMEATLKVDHVALNAGNPDKKPAYSVVVGQIHAVKYKSTDSGFGYGNEPLKIYYKKWPGHKTGSVFWNYERNLAKKDTNRRDISYPVWGHIWDNKTDPGASGVSLGEEFSYTVNVHKNTMHLTFESAGKPTVKHQINLANNRDANGKIDPLDNPYSYGGDSLYFKAGAYNQCSVKDDPGFWFANCGGTGDWDTDKTNGDYAQVAFTKLTVGNSTAP
ncbi:MAG: polysaccharide lyase family 7 protein [Hellea sp.]